MKIWKRLGTGAVVAFGLAALATLGSVSAVQAGVIDSGVVLKGCRIVGTDLANSCTMTESGVDCGGDVSLPLPPNSCSFWQFEMKRDNDFVCVQDVDLSSHNPKLSLPIKTGLGVVTGEDYSDAVCVGGTTVGGGSSGGWMTIRSENGDDWIGVGDCSCNGGVGGTEVYGLTTIATGPGHDTVIVDNAYFHSEVSIRVGAGNDDVFLDNIDCDGTDLPIVVNCGTDGGYLCVGAGVDTSCGLGDTDCCDVINDNGTCTETCI